MKVKPTEQVKALNKKINAALKLISKNGIMSSPKPKRLLSKESKLAIQKQWVIDQVARKLLGRFEYRAWVKKQEGWDTGIKPLE